MSNNLLVFLDTETGGLDPTNSSLLTAAYILYDTTAKKILNKLEFAVRHDPYLVSAGALNTNKIDLVQHHAIAAKPEQCIEMTKEWLYPYYKDQPANLVGHNVAFDVGFTRQMYKDQGHVDLFGKLFSHRITDTMGIAQFLKDAGKLAVDRCSLTHLLRHFNISVEVKDRHTALGDALATLSLYEKLLEVVG